MPKAAAKKFTPSTHTGLAIVLGGPCSFAASSGPGGALPGRILIAKWGANEARSQGKSFKVGATTLARFDEQQQNLGWDSVALDYEHQSVPGHPNYKAPPIEFAAHGRVEVVKDKGLYYIPATYTPSGRQHAPGYPDVSGMFIIDPATSEVIAVHSVALCQHGDVAGAEFAEAIAASALLGGGTDMETILSFAKDLLQLGDDATPADVATGLEELVREKNTPPTPPNPAMSTTAAATPPEKSALEKTVESLAASVGTLNTNVQSLLTGQNIAAHNTAVESVIAAGVAAGKKIPETLKTKLESGQYALSATQVTDILGAIPVTETVAFKTPEQVAAAQQPNANAEAENQIAASLGITPEKLKGTTMLAAGAAPAPGTNPTTKA